MLRTQVKFLIVSPFSTTPSQPKSSLQPLPNVTPKRNVAAPLWSPQLHSTTSPAQKPFLVPFRCPCFFLHATITCRRPPPPPRLRLPAAHRVHASVAFKCRQALAIYMWLHELLSVASLLSLVSQISSTISLLPLPFLFSTGVFLSCHWL